MLTNKVAYLFFSNTREKNKLQFIIIFPQNNTFFLLLV